MRPTLLALAFLAVLMAGCSASAGVREGTSTVRAGAGEEFDYELRAGDTLRWTWSSGADLSFDIHTHGADSVTEHVKHAGRAHTGSFTAASDGTYSMYWRNLGISSTQLAYHITKEG